MEYNLEFMPLTSLPTWVSYIALDPTDITACMSN